MTWERWALLIEKKNPLKQGLKPQGRFKQLVEAQIEKKNPLKQGLKQKPVKQVAHNS